MAAEETAQAIVRANLVDSPLSECSTLHVNDLLMSESINLFLQSQIKLSNEGKKMKRSVNDCKHRRELVWVSVG